MTVSKSVILNSALYGGDDYELLFSCNPVHDNFIKKLSSKIKLKLTKIGVFKELKKEFLYFKNDFSKLKKSYLHF